MNTLLAAALVVGLLIVAIGMIWWWTTTQSEPIVPVDGMPGMLHPIMETIRR